MFIKNKEKRCEINIHEKIIKSYFNGWIEEDVSLKES